MREVSCRILEMFFREAARKGVPAERLAEGMGLDLVILRTPTERIDWDSFRRFISNCEAVWNPAELTAIGGAWIDTPMFRYARIIAGVLFSPKQLYRWIGSSSKDRKGSGIDSQTFSCITSTFIETSESTAQIRVLLDDGYEMCPPFFLLTLGGFRELPRLVGSPRAVVEMRRIDRGAIYDIRLPPRRSFWQGVRRWLAWIFSPLAAAQELHEAHDQLTARYRELEAAQRQLERQAVRLETAHTLGALVHRNLDLALTAAMITDALIAHTPFEAVELELTVSVEGRSIRRRQARDGAGHAPDEPHLVHEIVGREGRLGWLRLWCDPTCDQEERQGLLEYLKPTLSMALDNSLSYQTLLDYRQNLEAKVEARTVELRAARDSLADTVSKLKEAQATRERIFANINHEVRTPLSLILLAVSGIRASLGSGPWPDKVHDRLRVIEQSGRKVLRLIDELLLLAAGREGKLKLTPTRLDLTHLLEEVISSWRPSAAAAGLTLSLLCPSECHALADPIALERVLANLLSNAIKFTPQGGSVRIEVSSQPAALEIAVRDSGVGIDDDLRRRLFGRFEQGQAGRALATGSGIGLSLVKSLIDAHGGSITVESPRGRGTTFRFSIPQADATWRPAPDERPRVAALGPEDFGIRAGVKAPPEIVEPPTAPRATILAAEDDPDLLAALGDLLGESYRVLLAPDGLAALRLAERHRPDLLVSDVGMPGMDGIELTRRFRELPGNRLAPVVLLSAFGERDDRLDGLEAGAVDYVVKPIDPHELRARVRAQLQLRDLALRLHETEQLTALGTLSAGLAHELRNPANGVVNLVGPLRELLPSELRGPDAPVTELLDVLEACAAQIRNLCADILRFSRPSEVQPLPESFASLVEQSLAMVPATAALTIDRDLTPDDRLTCTAALVRQVIVNLTDNAAQAAGPGGTVHLSSRVDGEWLVFDITDDGPGVPPALRERIFDPFFTSKPPGRGTGLGLSLARRIANDHGGSLTLEASERGARFRLRLPRGSPPVPLAPSRP